MDDGPNAGLERRIMVLEQDIIKVRQEQASGHRRMSDRIDILVTAMEKNNTMTAELHGWAKKFRAIATTGQIVGAVMKFFVKWVIIPVLGIYAIGYAIFHQGHLPEWFKEFLRGLIFS